VEEVKSDEKAVRFGIFLSFFYMFLGALEREAETLAEKSAGFLV
jgi:hypothetical protein